MDDYRIAWPILDDTLTLAQLINEAEVQLPDRCAELGLWQASTPTWQVREGHEVDGWAAYPGLLLTADIAVQPMTDTELRIGRVPQLLRERALIAAA